MRRFVQQLAKPLAEAVSARVFTPVVRSVAPIVDKFYALANQQHYPSTSVDEEWVQEQARKKNSVSRLSLGRILALQDPAPRLSVLRPLRSLGGLSLVSYMAIESTQGHFDMFRTWQADVANDLEHAIGAIGSLKKQLVEDADRIEDLEIMVNDLTSFIEVQKDELSRLKSQLA